MRIILIIFLATICLFGQDTIKVQFKPGTREDITPYLNKLFNQYKGKENLVFLFETGRYDFYTQFSTAKKYFELNTTVVNPRNCSVLIENNKNITLDGNGSEFIFHGKLQPFTIDNSSNITIKNLSLDWEFPFGAEVEIIDVKDDYFDLKIDKSQFPYLVENDKLYFSAEGWKHMWGGVKWNDPVQFDRELLRVTAGTDDDLLGENWENKYSAKITPEGFVRITYNNNKLLKKGNFLSLRHGVRDHAGVFMTESKNIVLDNIKMYSNSGMSFLAQYSENIYYQNVHCMPNRMKRKIISGHDDGFHHSNCKGLIKVTNCSFSGLMDDAFNVHGTSPNIIKKLDKQTFICKFMHHQSIGVEWAAPGDTIGIIDRQSMVTLGKEQVAEFELLDSLTFKIKFAEPLPDFVRENYALENLNWTPDVEISKSHFYSHRARGILVSTPGKVLIDNNIFETSGAAIVIPGDANGWFESGAVKNVTIKNNYFKNECNSSYYQFSDAVISIHPEIPVQDPKAPLYHRNINIDNNTFDVFDYPVFFAINTDGISFTNNIVKRSYKFEPRHKNKYTVTFNSCRNILMDNNILEENILGKNILLINTPREEFKSYDKDFRIEVRDK